MSKMKGGQVSGAEGSVTIDESFAEMEKIMAENNRKIASLQGQLKKMDKENGFLKKTIDQLNATIKDKDAYILDLQAQIGSLQNEVEGLKSKFAISEQEKEQVKQELTTTKDEMNAVYYAIGTRRELEERGVIDAKGLFNRNKDLNANIDESKFTKIDSRTESEIAVGNYKAKKIELVPTRPNSCYTLEENGGNVTLKITDAKTFWKNKFVAIVVK